MKCVFDFKWLFLCAVTVLSFSTSVSAQKVIKVPGVSSAEELPVDLLKEIVKRHPEYVLEFPYNNYDGRIAKSRLMSDVESGALDMFWSSTNYTFEEQFKPVRIPIFRGLLGYRIALIRQGNEHIFANVTSVEEIKKFKAGQGLLWADTKILRHNGITVVTTNRSPNLYPMLEGGRFDYFPRGIHQPWNELKRYPDLPLTVEPNIMLRYFVPNYFFLSTENQEIWALMNNTLEEMYADGTYQRLFRENKAIIEAITKSNIKERKIFDLINQTLPSETPLDRKELWFDPLRDSL